MVYAGLDEGDVDHRQVVNLTERGLGRPERAVGRLLTAVEVLDDVTVAQRVIGDRIALKQARDWSEKATQRSLRSAARW